MFAIAATLRLTDGFKHRRGSPVRSCVVSGLPPYGNHDNSRWDKGELWLVLAVLLGRLEGSSSSVGGRGELSTRCTQMEQTWPRNNLSSVP